VHIYILQRISSINLKEEIQNSWFNALIFPQLYIRTNSCKSSFQILKFCSRRFQKDIAMLINKNLKQCCLHWTDISSPLPTKLKKLQCTTWNQESHSWIILERDLCGDYPWLRHMLTLTLPLHHHNWAHVASWNMPFLRHDQVIQKSFSRWCKRNLQDSIFLPLT
jgi:hypothetical protein